MENITNRTLFTGNTNPPRDILYAKLQIYSSTNPNKEALV
jgi:hypothetical protein